MHRLFADVELAPDQLVGQSQRHQARHLELARRQALELGFRFGAARHLLARRAAELDRAPDGVDQRLILERLFQEVAGAVLHRLHRQFDVAVAGDEHDRHRPTALAQYLLQLQPAHHRHADVEHQAGDGGGLGRGGEEVLGRGVAGHRPAHGFEQEHQRAAKGGVVVDDVDQQVFGRGHGEFLCGGRVGGRRALCGSRKRQAEDEQRANGADVLCGGGR